MDFMRVWAKWTFILMVFLLSIKCEAQTASTTTPHGQIVKKHIDAFMHQLDAPGVAVALYYEGKGELYSFGYADPIDHKSVTPDTIFELASITKVFTSTILAEEVLTGKVQLTNPLAKYLPALNSTSVARRIKLVDLATHTSSLPRVPPEEFDKNRDRILDFLNLWTPEYPIGTKYVYSNLGFGVLGYALESLENENYGQLVRSFITGPLDMSSTMIVVPQSLWKNYAQGYSRSGEPIGEHYRLLAWPASGALRSTARDMLKFLEANLNVGGPDNLRKAMQFAQQSQFKVNAHLVMGLGWQRFTNKAGVLFIDKNGGVPGFSSYIGMLPHEKIGIVILVNRAKTGVTGIGRKILVELRKTSK